MRKVAAVFLALMSICGVSHANLIVNGSFENNDIPNNSWRPFNAGTVDGWSGTNMELWDQFQRFKAFDGRQYAELNANGNGGRYSIYQTINTIAGQSYDVSFVYAARRRKNESFRFDILDINDSVLFSTVIDDHKVKSWSEFYSEFTAQSNLTTIRFSTINRGTYGNFIDNVSVTGAPALALRASSFSVPEPSSILMLSAAMIFLAKRRKQR
jgi:hypothetical protein